jgi:predicted amidohydrolase
MRAGIFQSAGGGLSPEERLGRLSDSIQEQRLDIVLCPELFSSGYNIGDAHHGVAEARDGVFASKVRVLTRKHGTAIVYGYPERTADAVYNSAQCINSNGESIANHRKLLLPPGFESQYFHTGNSLTIFELNGFRVAVFICFDAEFPETIRAAAEAGAHLVMVPTALDHNWGRVAYQMMPTRAIENGVWLMYANHAGTEGDVVYLGASCIVAPDGHDRVRAGSDEQLICAELDIESVTVAQARLPYLHHVEQLRNRLK